MNRLISNTFDVKQNSLVFHGSRPIAIFFTLGKEKGTMNRVNGIRVAIAGLGNCASSLIEGIQYYRQNPESHEGLLFPSLACYSVSDIDIVAAFDISDVKVGKFIKDAIYQSPNNFVRIPGMQVDGKAGVFAVPHSTGIRSIWRTSFTSRQISL